MVLSIGSGGDIRCLYSEDMDLSALGALSIERASHVEPDATGKWWADMSPVGGPKFGPFALRSAALVFERMYLEDEVL